MVGGTLTGLALDLAGSTATGGWLCLLFCNTVENFRLERPADGLPDFAAWVKWSAKHGAISDGAARDLNAWAQAHPDEASRALDDAKELRVRLFRLLSAHAQGDPGLRDEVACLNRHMGSALSHLRLNPTGSGLEFENLVTPERMMWPVVYSAVALLTDELSARLRRCGGDKCTWLFIDESKNRSRRWCDMRVCGNRAKSRAHYRRTQRAASS